MFLENFKGFFSIYSYVNDQPLVVHNFNKLALILTEDASTLVTIFLTDRFQRGMIFKILLYIVFCENSILPCFGPTLPMGIRVWTNLNLNKLNILYLKMFPQTFNFSLSLIKEGVVLHLNKLVFPSFNDDLC